MEHFLLSFLCFALWAGSLNFLCLGLLLVRKRVSGSALVFTAGLACLMLIFGLGVSAHVDIAQTFRYAGLTLALSIPLLLKHSLKR